MQGMDDGPWTGARHARLVRRRLGRDDGGDDVPVGRADGRALLAHDQAPVAARAARSSRPATSSRGRAAGVLAFAVATRGGRHRRRRARLGPRRAAGSPAATLVVAAVYELTPLKDVCLGKCRSPLGFLLGSWRDGRGGRAAMGARHGAWCVGCCWALMASLFALGVMSIAWMAFVAGLIASRSCSRGVGLRPTARRRPARARRAAARRARRDPGADDPRARAARCRRWAGHAPLETICPRTW